MIHTEENSAFCGRRVNICNSTDKHTHGLETHTLNTDAKCRINESNKLNFNLTKVHFN